MDTAKELFCTKLNHFPKQRIIQKLVEMVFMQKCIYYVMILAMVLFQSIMKGILGGKEEQI